MSKKLKKKLSSLSHTNATRKTWDKNVNLPGANAPGAIFYFFKCQKKNCHLCHIQMRPAKLETKMLIILACAKKKNKSKTKCHPKFVFFTDETPLLRSAWILSSMFATPTWSSTIFFRILWKHLICFFGVLFIQVQMHPGAKTPPHIYTWTYASLCCFFLSMHVIWHCNAKWTQ